MKLKLESTLIPGPLQLSRTSRWHGGRGMAMSTVVIPPRSLAPSPQRDAEGSLPGSLWLRGAWHERTSSTHQVPPHRKRGPEHDHPAQDGYIKRPRVDGEPGGLGNQQGLALQRGPGGVGYPIEAPRPRAGLAVLAPHVPKTGTAVQQAFLNAPQGCGCRSRPTGTSSRGSPKGGCSMRRTTPTCPLGAGRQLIFKHGQPVTFFITGTLNTDTTNMSEPGTLMTEHMSEHAVQAEEMEVPNVKVMEATPFVKLGSAVNIIGVNPHSPETIANASGTFTYATSLVTPQTFPTAAVGKIPTQANFSSVGRASNFPQDARFQLTRKLWAPEKIAKAQNAVQEDYGLSAHATSSCPPLVGSPLIADDPDLQNKSKMTRLDWAPTLAYIKEGKVLPIGTHSINQAPATTVITVYFNMELVQRTGSWRLDWVPVRIHVDGVLNAGPNTKTFYANKVVETTTPSPRKRKTHTWDTVMTPGNPQRAAPDSTPPASPSAGSSTNATASSSSTMTQVQLRVLAKMAQLKLSDLHASKAGDRKYYYERPNSDGKGGLGMLTEKVEGKHAQFAYACKYIEGFLKTHVNGDFQSFSVVQPVSTRRSVRPISDRPQGKAIVPAAREDGLETLTFANIKDDRGCDDLNDAVDLADLDDLDGNPDVIIVFTCMVWKGGSIPAFTGCPKGGPDKAGWLPPMDIDLVSITLIGNTGEGGGGYGGHAGQGGRVRGRSGGIIKVRRLSGRGVAVGVMTACVAATADPTLFHCHYHPEPRFSPDSDEVDELDSEDSGEAMYVGLDVVPEEEEDEVVEITNTPPRMLGNYGTNALSVTLEPASQPVSPGTVTPYTAPSSYPSHWQDDDLSSVPQATSFVPGWQDGYVPPAPPAPALPR
ncbi:uncharacterized protein MKK02DRAFT_33241 [Dioszegia hungarica]|uniref:Uncharacterized protein n=1 Tax=Dioszegia hungarica TaxID=4972 RepID=A0AA38H809_9TREE|nr:uncharacterized protein MKK02DRAFT_33241 [Dioszegia hungarica]KAI9635933.1 hypothetical protein MKK02DRAFT_33241 [Dioszegia hungarica]